MNAASAKSSWVRGQRGWPARYPLVQFPNAPLVVSLAASLVHAVTDDDTADYANAVSRLALGVWAWLELADGDNGYRRVLGAVVFVLITRSLAQDLG